MMNAFLEVLSNDFRSLAEEQKYAEWSKAVALGCERTYVEYCEFWEGLTV